MLENHSDAGPHQDTREVDLTLGKIQSGAVSRPRWWAWLRVSGFMLVYYLLAGMGQRRVDPEHLHSAGCDVRGGDDADVPGIAGIVLTVGMAVDANVLIFERIREESAKGTAAPQAGCFGLLARFSTPCNTLISQSFLPRWAPVSRGFGVSLTIGVAASLFTALVVTRLIFDFLLERT